MMPVEPLVIWCERCRDWFFIEDTREIVDLPFGTEPGEHKVIPVSDALEADVYLEVIDRGWPREREIRLRLRLMREYNNHLRYNHGKKDPATIESHDNLERLSELLDPAEDALMLAEVHRELGEFDRAIDIAASIAAGEGDEEPDTVRAERIIQEAERRNIFPVLLNEDVLLPDNGLNYPECIDAGYYPFPAAEDVFAFADGSKEEEYRPILSVHFSLIQREEDSWAPFCYGDGSWLNRYDRLFSREEWKEFLTWPEEVRNELMDFWEMKNFHLDQFGKYELDFYYRMLYRIFFGYLKPPAKGTFDRHLRRFRPVWERLRGILLSPEMDPDISGWMGKNEYMVYWHSFWAGFSGKIKLEELNTDMLIAFMKEKRDREKERQENRNYALRHIEHVELGGSPGWFKGVDKSAELEPGHSRLFVGQFWSDYLGYGTRLLYLFYNTEESRFDQFHDYD
jgi:hypothetical protein